MPSPAPAPVPVPELSLTIGNKNYSSWSMRPWVLMREAGIAFREVRLRFDSMAPEGAFKQAVHAISPAGTVPVLSDGNCTVSDTLAIVETLHEWFPQAAVWPADRLLRAQARSACAEMHAGFRALRSHCPMNIEAALPQVGAVVWRDQPSVRADVARLVAMWSDLLQQHRGPMLFGAFSAADAYFAPVCSRIRTYALPVADDIAAYVERVHALHSVRDWVAAALAEHDFVDFDEPYRAHR